MSCPQNEQQLMERPACPLLDSGNESDDETEAGFERI